MYDGNANIRINIIHEEIFLILIKDTTKFKSVGNFFVDILSQFYSSKIKLMLSLHTIFYKRNKIDDDSAII